MGLFGRRKTADAPSGPQTSAMDPLEVMRQARPWVMASDFLAADMLESSFGYHREIGDGLIAVLAVAHAEHATLMTDDDLAAFDAETLWTTALQSLQSEPIDKTLAMQSGATEFQVAFGMSSFMTSRLLMLPQFLEDAVGSGDAPHGVAIAVPSRHQLAFHVVGGFEVIQAVSGMTDYARECHATAASPLSPDVYYWSAEGLSRITYPKEGGGTEVRFAGPIMEALAEIDGESP